MGAMKIVPVEYRRGDEADVPRLVGLPRPGEAGGDARMALYLAGEHHPQEALPLRALFLAEAGGEPLGYVAGHLTRRFGCEGELQWIYVVPDQRRRGVASHLLELLAAWFLEHGARRVCVDVGDDAARPFYRRHGATELNRHWMIWEDIAVVLHSSATRANASVRT
jgi:GNAT superfamily N-acetyltransferase